jgi:hypothetical protein
MYTMVRADIASYSVGARHKGAAFAQQFLHVNY